MAVAFRASATGGANPTTSTTITVPASTATNDIVFVAITNRGATADPTVTDNEGAGAYALVKHQDAATNGAGSVWWKRASANTNSKTITVSGLTDSCSAVCYVVSGAITTEAPFLDISGTANASGTETMAAIPGGSHAVSPAGGGLNILCIFNTNNDNAVTTQNYTGAGNTANAAEHLSTGGNDCGCNVSSVAESALLSANGTATWAQTDGVTASISFCCHSAVDTDTIPLVAAATRQGATTTSSTIKIPSNVTTNDILLTCQTNRDATTDPTVTDDEGAGSWAKLTNQNATTNGAGTVFWKRASSSTHDKTITVSGLTGSCAQLLAVFRNCSTGATPYEVGASEANASGNETQVGYTPSVNGTRVCFAVFNTSNDTLAVTTMACTDPGALLKQIMGNSSGGNDCSVDFASKYQTTAGATGNFTWAQTDGVTASIAFGLLPVSSAATVIPVSATAIHTVSAGALAQTNLLVSVSPSTGHTVSAGALAQANILVSVSGTQGHTVASPGLARILVAVAATQSHTVAVGALAQSNTLVSVPGSQGHTVASPGLLQLNILPVAIDTQGHTVAVGKLVQAHIAIPVPSITGHNVAAGAMLQNHIARTVSAITGHIADPSSFPSVTVVTVVNAITGHTAQVGILQVFVPGQSLPSRIYAVLEDGRTYLVLPRNETIH